MDGERTSANKAEFRIRAQCPACGEPSYDVLWTESFDHPEVRRMMETSFYSGDVEGALSGAHFELVRCRSCSQMYHRRVLSPEWLSIVYGEWTDDLQIERFEETHTNKVSQQFEIARQMVKHVLRIQRLVDPGTRAIRLLDFGCGDADFLRVAALFGFECYGIDFSTARSERASRAGVRLLPDWESFDALQVEDLDAVCMFEVLEHVDQPNELVRSVAARLRPGGVAVIEVPDCSQTKAGPVDSFDAFHRVHPLEHINNFTEATLNNLCQKHGLRRIPRPVAHASVLRRAALRTELGRLVTRARTRGTAGYFEKV